MTGAWRDRLESADRSLLVTIAVLAELADEAGELTLADLVRGYREALTSPNGSGDETGGTRGGRHGSAPEFSEGVLARMQDVVLPALVRDGWIYDGGEDGWERVVARPEWWDDARRNRAEIRAEILARAMPHPRVAFESPAGAVPAVGSVLSAEGLNKAFKRRRVVKDVSLQLGQGEVVGLLGPNGAGKTTTFYLITGLIKPDRGRICLDGTEITTEPMYRRARAGIGYLAQEPSVFRRMTVEENVLAILETIPLSRDARRQRLTDLLEELGLAHLRKNKAYGLSGGERRRLELTRALVTSPKFMLLDEPFAGVDPIAVHDIQSIVAGLRQRGIGVLITDHSVEQTLEIVDRAYIMFEGTVQAAGTVRELVFNDQVADLYLGPTLTARLRARMEATS